jgi:hypothetical protein
LWTRSGPGGRTKGRQLAAGRRWTRCAVNWPTIRSS